MLAIDPLPHTLVFAPSGIFVLGHPPTANHVPLSAFVDEFCVFNVSLHKDPIAFQTLYARGCGAGAVNTYPALQQNLAYRLSFDEDREEVPEFKDGVTGNYSATGDLLCTFIWDGMHHASPMHVPSTAPFLGDGNTVSFFKSNLACPLNLNITSYSFPSQIATVGSAASHVTMTCNGCTNVTINTLTITGTLKRLDNGVTVHNGDLVPLTLAYTAPVSAPVGFEGWTYSAGSEQGTIQVSLLSSVLAIDC